MKVSVRTSVSLERTIIEELEGRARQSALEKTAEWVLSEIKISGVTPRKDGYLEDKGFVSIVSEEVIKIIFDTPYARRWYFNSEGAVFRKDRNPNAQDHWMDEFIYGERRSEVIEVYAMFYREEIGGILS